MVVGTKLRWKFEVGDHLISRTHPETKDWRVVLGKVRHQGINFYVLANSGHPYCDNKESTELGWTRPNGE